MEKIILASASPRRKELMTMAGLAFDVIVSDCEENITYEGPEDMVKKLSFLKARDVADKICKTETAPHLVIGADTTVLCEGRVLGKPKDKEEAKEVVRRSSRLLRSLANSRPEEYSCSGWYIIPPLSVYTANPPAPPRIARIRTNRNVFRIRFRRRRFSLACLAFGDNSLVRGISVLLCVRAAVLRCDELL